MERNNLTVIVLAAGGGTRMKSKTMKVLHPIGGRSMVGHVLRAVQAMEPERIVAVVGHQREQVGAHIRSLVPDVVLAVQDEQHGTGHAVRVAMECAGTTSGTVVVAAADTPLLEGESLRAFAAEHEAAQRAVSILSGRVGDPFGYGRIVRNHEGDVEAIVEEKDATATQREISEINSGILAFDAEFLVEALPQIGNDNAKGEYYLTDAVQLARDAGLTVGAFAIDDVMQTQGANDRAQLAELGREMNRRIVTRWMTDGVTVMDPATTWIDADVVLEPDVTILPGTQLLGATVVREDAVIGPDCTLKDCEIGAGARVVRAHGELAVIGDGANVGPFAYLRPGSQLGAGGKIGTFVETKNAQIGPGAQGAAPLLRGGRRDRRGHQHRRRHDLRQLRRREEVPHGDRARTSAPPPTTPSSPRSPSGTARAAGPAPSYAVTCRPARWRSRAVRSATSRAGRSRSGPVRPRATPPRRPAGKRRMKVRRLTSRHPELGAATPVRENPDRPQTGERGAPTVTGMKRTTEKNLMVFSGRAHPELSEEVARLLGTGLVPQSAYEFANSEIYIRYEESVRGSDAFVIQSHTAPINEWIMEHLIMVDALKRASAKRITVVMPFYGYARQDKKHRGREPISARLMADLFKTAGADRLITVDLHADQIQGFFDGPVDHLMALPILTDYVREKYGHERLAVVSPDAGRIKVAERWSARLGGAPLAFIHKTRNIDRPNETMANRVVGQVEGRICVLVDDMIDTGGTIVKAAEALMADGAAGVVIAATHAILSDPAVDRLKNCSAAEVIVTNTLPISADRKFDKLTELSIAPLLARAIREVFEDGSVTSMFDGHA